ncbi:MAG TPA: mechanosensitive ion channel domain-containing protein [Candidatus Krumholzibacteria bacterium]|nr:mechanosensitive ion channel domain-containing protein [Candidatus Krumholzibacteria bacterium]
MSRWLQPITFGRADTIKRVHWDIAYDVVIGGILATAAIIGALKVLGIDVAPEVQAIQDLARAAASWFPTHGLPIALIVVPAWLLTRILKRVLPRFVQMLVIRMAGGTVDRSEVTKRAGTLTNVLSSTITMLIVVIAVLMVLSQLAVPIGPILGGLGIAGIAVGFGAQWLIRDLINGIFIIAENQYREGDVATLNGISGLVESINLRRTVLRDLDGKVHVVPNGTITVASNFTKHWSRVNLDIGVAYRTDMDHAFRVLNEIGQELANEPYWAEKLIDPPKVVRINSFDDSAITIKVLGVCKPLMQWEIMGEMRMRIKKRFDAEDIEIPFPHRTIYWGFESHPLELPPGAAARLQASPAKLATLLTQAETMSPDDIVLPSEVARKEAQPPPAEEAPPAEPKMEAPPQEPLDRQRAVLEEERKRRAEAEREAAKQPPTPTEKREDQEGKREPSGEQEARPSGTASSEEEAEPEHEIKEEDLTEEEQKLLREAEKSEEERNEEARRQAEILTRGIEGSE